MPSPERIDDHHMALRAARELAPGEVAALGPGLPGLVPGAVPEGTGVVFLSESGVVGVQNPDTASAQGAATGPGSAVVSTVELAAMARAGYVDAAVLQPAQVGADGGFCHWTSAATPGLLPPASAVELACGAGRVVFMLPHTAPDGQPNIVAQCTLPIDGVASRGVVITDIGILNIDQSGLTLAEVAPGWRSDDVAALTGASVKVSDGLAVMDFTPPEPGSFNKVYSSGVAAISDMPDGAVVMIDGFAGPGGMPHYLMVALRGHGAKDLTMVSNTAGIARIIGFGTPPGYQAIDHSILIENGQIRKAIASYPVSPSPARPSAFELAWQRGEVEIEVVPQGTLAERIRAGGAGVAAFYTPTGAGTLLTEGKETRTINGKEYVLEPALRADYCLIRGYKADTLGNVVYKGTSRNFNAVMAPAATITVIEVDEIVEPGELDPEAIITPGVYIDRVVRRPADFSPYE